MLDMLAGVDELPLHTMYAKFPMGRTEVSKHLRVLAEAGLVGIRKGVRQTRYRRNAAPLRSVEEWVSFYERFWAERRGRLRGLVEKTDP